jgi:hypothetical protein
MTCRGPTGFIGHRPGTAVMAVLTTMEPHQAHLSTSGIALNACGHMTQTPITEIYSRAVVTWANVEIGGIT